MDALLAVLPVSVAPRGYMPAESLFTDAMAAAVAWSLLIGMLVVVLIGGGLLVLNLGLMSKRPGDHVGQRDPSDVNLLKSTLHPELAAEEKRWLPAEEGEEVAEGGEAERGPSPDEAGAA